MHVYDSLIRIARWLPEPIVRVVVFGSIGGLFILSVLVIFIIVPFERGARLRWRRFLMRKWNE